VAVAGATQTKGEEKQKETTMRTRWKKKHEDEESESGRPLPPEDFLNWWNPYATDEPSGASIGGHPDAARMWARKDPGRWTRRASGITATRAWLCACYRDEFNRWKDAGCPETEPFVSIALPLPEQKAKMDVLKGTLKQVGKPMPTEDKQPLPKSEDDPIDFSYE
jgi:hypothetical protein